ncbi:hypothetical protein [Bacillus sp. UMB0728]|uniref:hypothetical protein n=1 Tax=Bacillus sp. UMB0728 TaxID=2066052 RepID=UPI000C755C41|nr:hypothetical protein [Bacillus sp. UMB0728]PLR72297.1 hypothetical protein CYJ37_12125 [Bacillus sp. UMB0728]
MAGYPRDEQETVLVFEVETGKWMVYSTVPKHIRKLMKLGEMEVTHYDEDRPIAIKGKLEEKQVSMKKVREYSEEQRAKMSERSKAMRAK